SCIGREYLYRILSRRARPGLMENHLWHIPTPLDANAMRAGARHLIGHHDFTSFRSSECQAKSPLKTLDSIDITPAGYEWHIRVRSRSFLHNQVRIMVGTLVETGLGKRRADEIPAILDAKNRSAAGQTAPAQGLYFMDAF